MPSSNPVFLSDVHELFSMACSISRPVLAMHLLGNIIMQTFSLKKEAKVNTIEKRIVQGSSMLTLVKTAGE